MEAKKIIITGGATRIGSAIAKSLAGYDVKNKIYPKGRSTLGMPGTRVTKKRDKKWKHGR